MNSPSQVRSPRVPRRPPHNDVMKLPAELRQFVERMLVEGATFEDTVEAVNERGGEHITLNAVQSFFRSSLDLQQRRIKRQLETAKALKKALGDPRSGQAELADAIIMTGMMRLNKRGAELDVADTMRGQLLRENQNLKEQVVRLRERALRMQQEMMRARLKNELARWELAKIQITELHRSVHLDGSQTKLGPETIQKIQEIYGLVSQSAPADQKAAQA